MYGRGSLHPLSPEKETGAFLLFACGNDLDLISVKLSLPKEVLYFTAMYYNWPEKQKILQSDEADTVKSLQADLAKTLLIATSMAIRQELGDVISGKKPADKCQLIPKNPKALKETMDFINQALGIQTAPTTTNNTIQAGTVVINNRTQEIRQENEDVKVVKYKELNDSIK